MINLLKNKVVFGFESSKENLETGQALILILVSMSIVLTLVLSAVSRSITDVNITNQEEQSLRAFSAAEAGVERALLQNTVSSFSDPNFSDHNTGYSVEFPTGSVGDRYQLPNKLYPVEVGTFWFVKHEPNGELTCNGGGCTKASNIEFCFGDQSSPVNPAIEIQFYYDKSGNAVASPNNYANVRVGTITVDSTGDPNFDINASSCGMPGLKYSSGLINIRSNFCVGSDPDGCLIMAKVRMLKNYNAGAPVPMPVAARLQGGPNPSMPAQGVTIQSTGTSGQSTRRLSVTRSFATLPDVFDSTIYSGRDLFKE